MASPSVSEGWAARGRSRRAVRGLTRYDLQAGGDGGGDRTRSESGGLGAPILGSGAGSAGARDGQADVCVDYPAETAAAASAEGPDSSAGSECHRRRCGD